MTFSIPLEMGEKTSKAAKPSLSPSSKSKGQHVLEGKIGRGEWDSVLFHLKSPEGCDEVQNVDGLISYQGRMKIATPRLWTAIFHHAPIDIVHKMYNIR